MWSSCLYNVLCCRAGPNNKPNKIDAVSNPKGFFGTTRFGFSKANEVFVGRTGADHLVKAVKQYGHMSCTCTGCQMQWV